MKKCYLLTAVAASALMAAAPALAEDSPSSSGNLLYLGYISQDEMNIETDVSFETEINLEGTINVHGDITADSAASAANSSQQNLGEGDGGGDNASLAVEDSGSNQVPAFNVGGSGNVGVNIAAGFANEQANSAVMAVSADNRTAALGGSAAAATESLQSIQSTGYENNEPGDSESSAEQPSAINNLAVGTIAGNGNIGVNAAAGTFNQQANLMTLAVASDSVLAHASAGLVQTSYGNEIGDQTGPNTVNAGNIGAGSSGNIGVNLAAGVGNQQVNSLTIATSSAASPGTGGGGGTTGT